MSLFRYLRPVGDDVLDSKGPLSQCVPSAVLEEVNKEITAAARTEKKLGKYSFFSPEEKVKVAKYASIHGVHAAVSHFSKSEYPLKKLKANTVRDWVKA